MASAVPYCDICQLRNISKQAATRCSECEESMCSECNEHHDLAKATRNHKTISISDYQSLPASVLDIKHYCEEHDDKFEFYCPSHATVCCVKCIDQTHNECRGIKSLREAIKDIKSSAVLSELESDLSDIRGIYKRVKEDKVQNLRDISQQEFDFKEDIRNLRRQVDSHLDVLEQNILSSLEFNKLNCENKITGFTSLLDHKMKLIENHIDNITKYKQHASELQTFLGLREIETSFEEEKEFVMAMKSRSDFLNFELKLKVSPTFEYFNTSATSLGSIETEQKNSSVQIALKSDKQAQIRQSDQIPEMDAIDKVTLTKIVEFNIKEHITGYFLRITGCEILDTNKILIANEEGKEILVYTKQGNFQEKFELPFKPFDICQINKQQIVISSRFSNSICIFDMELRKIVRQITTTSMAFGLGIFDGKIFCRISSAGIQVFNSTLDPISEIKISSTSTTRLSVSSGRIYYQIVNEQCVVCCDVDGKEKLRVTTPSVNGVSCSRDGCVFYIENSGNKVNLISKDGKKIRTILEKKDGLVNPRCIHFRNQSSQLLVCNDSNGYVFLYNIIVM